MIEQNNADDKYEQLYLHIRIDSIPVPAQWWDVKILRLVPRVVRRAGSAKVWISPEKSIEDHEKKSWFHKWIDIFKKMQKEKRVWKSPRVDARKYLYTFN